MAPCSAGTMLAPTNPRQQRSLNLCVWPFFSIPLTPQTWRPVTFISGDIKRQLQGFQFDEALLEKVREIALKITQSQREAVFKEWMQRIEMASESDRTYLH